MSCTSAAAYTLLGVPLLVGVSRHRINECTVTRGSCHNFWHWSWAAYCLSGNLLLLFTLFWMMWKHPNVTSLMLGVSIDASFLTELFDHSYLLLLSLLLSTIKNKGCLRPFPACELSTDGRKPDGLSIGGFAIVAAVGMAVPCFRSSWFASDGNWSTEFSLADERDKTLC